MPCSRELFLLIFLGCAASCWEVAAAAEAAARSGEGMARLVACRKLRQGMPQATDNVPTRPAPEPAADECVHSRCNAPRSKTSLEPLRR